MCSENMLEIFTRKFLSPKFTIRRHMTQIEGLDLVYQNHVTLSAASMKIFDLKVGHYPQNGPQG